MTPEQKLEYMRLAAAFAGIQVSIDTLDMLFSLYDLVLEKKGETDLMSLSDTVATVQAKYKPNPTEQ